MRLWPTKGGVDSLAPGSTACLAEADAKGIVVLTVGWRSQGTEVFATTVAEW